MEKQLQGGEGWLLQRARLCPAPETLALLRAGARGGAFAEPHHLLLLRGRGV